MKNILKDMWYKWRYAVYIANIEALGLRRLALKDKQVELRQKANECLEKAKEARRV